MAVDINITPIIREVTIEIGQGGGDAVWGDIIGTLSNQTDLALQQTAQDDLISTNATDIGTNVTGILALDTSQGVQDTAIGLNTAKVTFPEAPNDGTQYARKDLGWEAVATGGAVDSVNTKTGVVVLTPDDIPRRTLTDATVTGTQDLDYDLYESFIFTLTGNVTLTESNVYDKIFTMSVTGDFAITYPSGWSTFVSGVYDGTVQNTFTVWRISAGVYKVQISQPS